MFQKLTILLSEVVQILLGANLDDIIKIATYKWSIRNSSFQEYTQKTDNEKHSLF